MRQRSGSASSSPAAASRPRPRFPSRASPSLLSGVFAEAAQALVPLRRRALEVALLLAEPGQVPPDSTRSGSPCSMCSSCAGGAWAGGGGARRSPVARPAVGRGAPAGTPPRARPSESASWRPCGRRRGTGSLRARPLLPRPDRLRLPLGPLEPGGAPPAAQERLGLELPGPSSPAWGGDGRQPVLRAGARPRACPRHTRAQPGRPLRVTGSLRSCSAPPRTVCRSRRVDVLLRVAATGAADGRGRRGGPRRSRASARRRSSAPPTRASSSSTTRAFASRIRC